MKQRLVVAIMLLVAGLLLAPLAQRHLQARQRTDLGERLLLGLGGAGDAGPIGSGDAAAAGPLRGRLAGHPDLLPVVATRCVNCHAVDGSKRPPSAAAFGPALGPATLARALARRGGPPSRYDADSLCRLLREGVDPAWVVIDAAMPRYEIDAAQCQALWARLSHPPPS
jgi:hypothetical protein